MTVEGGLHLVNNAKKHQPTQLKSLYWFYYLGNWQSYFIHHHSRYKMTITDMICLLGTDLTFNSNLKFVWDKNLKIQNMRHPLD
jgi:hypothetical protein